MEELDKIHFFEIPDYFNIMNNLVYIVPISELEDVSLSTFLNETSLNTLFQNVVQNFAHTKKRYLATDEVDIIKFDYTAFLGVKTLFVKGQAMNEGRKYNPMILFTKVAFEPESTNDNITVISTDNKGVHFKQLSEKNTDVKVRCNCSSFYYDFSFYNFKDGSIYGRKPKPYVRKTDNYPPRNPAHVPGLCKHLMKLSLLLKSAGVIS